MFINGQFQIPTTDFTVAGLNVTYLAVDYAISTTDRVHFVYDR